MGAETPKEDLPQQPSKPIDFTSTDVKKPMTLSEIKEGVKEKLEGTVSGPCRHESMKNHQGEDEKNLIGLTKQQRDDLGCTPKCVEVKDYVTVIVDGEGSARRCMVVLGFKESIGKDDVFTANGIDSGKKISVQKE